jgi:hypothetical protein
VGQKSGIGDDVSKVEFLEQMRSMRARWEAVIAEADEAQSVQPGVEGEWSLKDIIAHVTAYERGLVEWLEAASRGEAVLLPDLDHPDVDYRNAVIFARNRHLSLQEVMSESRQVFQHLLKLVDGRSNEELAEPWRTEWFVRPRWRTSRALWECIADDSYRHYRQHIPGIRTWLDEQGKE